MPMPTPSFSKTDVHSNIIIGMAENPLHTHLLPLLLGVCACSVPSQTKIIRYLAHVVIEIEEELMVLCALQHHWVPIGRQVKTLIKQSTVWVMNIYSKPSFCAYEYSYGGGEHVPFLF